MRAMDLIDIGRYLGALLLVLSLVGFAGLAARKFGLPGLVKPQVARRLQIVESLMLSPRQKLMLVRRDGVEHLVMMGPDGSLVIENAITPPVPQTAAAFAYEPAP
jgi:flagellar protein FliO/FliZ